MKFIRAGKTKDVYQLNDGNYLLKFKDTVTGHAGGQSDPGGNTVVGTVDGVGSNALKVTTYYFEKFKTLGIPSHYVNSNVDQCELVVRPATMFGKGLEFVVRYGAYGSFIRRFGMYSKEGDTLPAIFEVTLKDDDRNDPPATKEILVALGLISAEEYDNLHDLSIKICGIIKDDLASKGLDLVDIKLEFGRVDGKVVLIDEVSAGNMRVYKNGKKLDYLELSKYITL